MSDMEKSWELRVLRRLCWLSWRYKYVLPCLLWFSGGKTMYCIGDSLSVCSSSESTKAFSRNSVDSSDELLRLISLLIWYCVPNSDNLIFVSGASKVWFWAFLFLFRYQQNIPMARMIKITMEMTGIIICNFFGSDSGSGSNGSVVIGSWVALCHIHGVFSAMVQEMNESMNLLTKISYQFKNEIRDNNSIYLLFRETFCLNRKRKWKAQNKTFKASEIKIRLSLCGTQYQISNKISHKSSSEESTKIRIEITTTQFQG